MGVKQFVLKKALKRQLKKMPEPQRSIFEQMLEKHPELFENIARDVEEKKKAGVDESLAMISVMKKYEPQLRKIATQL